MKGSKGWVKRKVRVGFIYGVIVGELLVIVAYWAGRI